MDVASWPLLASPSIVAAAAFCLALSGAGACVPVLVIFRLGLLAFAASGHFGFGHRRWPSVAVGVPRRPGRWTGADRVGARGRDALTSGRECEAPGRGLGVAGQAVGPARNTDGQR